MTAADLAAYIGAAAWLPQIVTWLRDAIAKPVLTIIPDDRVELGFTAIGPVFNLRIAFSADRADIVINDFQIDIVHDDGDLHTLRWAGLHEDIGETRDALGIRQGKLTKEQDRPIALKIGTVALVEKLVRFNESKYKDNDATAMQALVEQFNFLRTRDPNYVNVILGSRELNTAVETRAQSFWWKPGRYRIRFRPGSSSKFKLRNEHYSLTLSQMSADSLRRNIPDIRLDLENTIKSNLPDFKVPNHHWRWAYETLKADEQK